MQINTFNESIAQDGLYDNVYFEKEHEIVDLEIDDLKNLILKYIDPDYDVLLCNELISEIFRFEKDILDHARMEDKILIPMIQQIQNKN